MSSRNNSKDPDGSYYNNNNDDDEINNYYSDLLNPSNNAQPAAFASTTNVSINDYDITGGAGGDYNYNNSNKWTRRITY